LAGAHGFISRSERHGILKSKESLIPCIMFDASQKPEIAQALA